MCTVPSCLPFQESFGSVEMQLPSLKGVTVPSLENASHLSDEPSFVGHSYISRPSLKRIITSSSPEIDVQSNGPIRPAGHKHSRSLEAPVGSAPFSATECPDSAFCDTFPSSWLKQLDTVHELPPSSLPGLYISQSSRKSSVAAVTSISALPSLDPVLNPPSPLFDSEEIGEPDEDPDNEDLWNLIPYDISWGPTYYGYREGTLPGPDGKCIFLRSPTPLKYQRTGQACEKCRERKAKCSGSRPSCARCVMRGLACVYASDAKCAKSEDSSDENEACEMPASVQIIHSESYSAPISPKTARVRRNTDCGSHGARVPVPSRNAALRRRHSTIGAPYSATSTSGNSRYQTSREGRTKARAAEANDAKGFLSALLDPLVVFPENSSEADDLRVSESSRLSYHSLPRRTEPIMSWTTPAYFGLDPGAVEGGIGDSTFYPEQRDPIIWDVQLLSCDELLQNSDIPAADSHCPDVLEKHQIHAVSTSCLSDQLYHTNTAYSGDYPHHQTPGDEGAQIYSAFAAGNEAGLEGQDAIEHGMVHMSCVSEPLGQSVTCWSAYDTTTQGKLEQMDYSMGMDSPHIALPCHSPDFYNFDYCTGTRTWFSLDDG